ncbi:hypothetical protein [Mesorhizobium xinjiangense]|uniref:hypothetical protein n=1 Tax=Mesorhizobium xinjiangense TaxID=2678685 RepID=UPI0012ECCCA5|nr:hypothetical protein [Mesorhizobium xinjiangense]
MADFVAVLRKTIGGLGETTPEIREKVYQKARNTIEAKLAALNPPPPPAAADRQRQALEDAIRTLEAEYAPAQPDASDPLNELDELFHELATTKPSDRAHDGDAAAAAVADQELVGHEPWFKPVPDDDPAEAAEAAAERATTDPAEFAATDDRAEFAVTDDAATDPLVDASDWPEQDAAIPPEEEPAAVDIAAADGTAPQETQNGPETTADEPAAPGRSRIGWVIAALVLLAIAGGGYAAWLNKDSLGDFVASLQQDSATGDDAGAPSDTEDAAPPAEPDEGSAQDGAQPESAPATPEGTAPEADQQDEGAASDGPEKFTQRLLADGSEIDAGRAGEEATIGEGTSVAASTPSEPSAAPDTSAGVPVGQKAIFYEERTNVAEGSAENGSVVWSLVQESPGGDLPPEPAIRAEVTIPGRDLQLRMTIRRNGDESLPASHIVELIFLAPEGFADGGIDNVLRMTMKSSEEATGNPLLGIPAKIADGFFLIALDNGETEVEANMTQMRRQDWIDVPVVYKSGRRALFTMEKGIPGDKVFDEALKAWQSGTSG